MVMENLADPPATPGLIALLGSGETASSGGAVFEHVARRLAPPLRVAILETPAGFQPNSAHVAAKVAAFVETRLRNTGHRWRWLRRGAVERPKALTIRTLPPGSWTPA